MTSIKFKVWIGFAAVLVLVISAIVWWKYPNQLLKINVNEVVRIELFNGNNGILVEVADYEQIEKIVDNLNGISLVKDKFVKEFTGFAFSIEIFMNSGEIHTLTILSTNKVLDGSFICKTKNTAVDTEFLYELTARD